MEEQKKQETPMEQETAPEVAAEETVKAENPPKEEKKKKKKNEWEEKFKEEHDQYLRLYAEYDNFRKRTAKERDRLVGDGVAKGIKAILPAIDNLERAIAAAGEGEGALKSGVEMTLRQLLDQLKNIGVTPIGEVGEIFDPNHHEAIMHIEDEAYQEGEIVEVFQRGYLYKDDQVIRAAVVKTAN